MTKPGVNPVTGIAAGALVQGGSLVITYQVRVQSFPTSGTLISQAAFSCSYTLPSGRTLSGTGNSNSVTTAVAPSHVALLKSASDAFVTIGDVLTYTVHVTNNGNPAVTNGLLFDLMSPGTEFVGGTVTVSGTSNLSANPVMGITIPTLIRNTSVTVTYQARIVSLPPVGSLVNTASFTFNNGTNAGTSYSNTVVTPLIAADIRISNQASVSQATVGDMFPYSFLIGNSGNTPATATLTDQLSEGIVFVANSVLINNEPVPGIDPISGIPVTIPAGGSTLVSFMVDVVSVPDTRTLVNQADIAYVYNMPDGASVSGTAVSNTETIVVTLPDVALRKSVSQSLAVAGDVLVFTSQITNNGISSIYNVMLYDPLSSNLAFMPGSVMIDGLDRPTASPATGITLGTVAAGVTVSVSFEVIVTMAVPDSITNQSTVSFTSGSFSATTASNTTVTPVTQPQISLLKSASTSHTSVGNTVAYTLVISNSGNVAADVTLTDPLPSGADFMANSVIVNGFPVPSASPITGIAIGSLNPGATATVNFSVVVTSLPVPQLLVNTATAAFAYSLPDGRSLDGTALSNTVSIPVSAPDVGVTLSTASTALTIGDTVTYSSVITNNGIETVNDVVFTSAAPNGSVFIGGTVTINGIAAVGEDPATGIAIGSIPPGASATVSFSNRVVAVTPTATLGIIASVTFTSGAFSGTALSNQVSTPVFQPVLTAVKSASENNATVGDTVTYTVTVTNSGNYASLLTVTDSFPAGVSFVPNSVLVNGSPSAGTDPLSSINAGLLEPGVTTTIQFSVIIDSLPNPQQLSNQAVASYSYTLPDGRTFTQSEASNIVSFPVSAPNVSAVKSASLSAAAIGETITYTTVVTNNGIAAVSNVLLLDLIPTGTSFGTGTVTIDGISRPADNPAMGIPLGSIAPGSAVSVTFQVQITALPNPAEISNQSSVTFTSGSFSGTAFSNTVITRVYQPILSAVKTGSTSNASVGSNLTYTITLTNAGNFGAAVSLTDPIPEGTSLVPNSVIVNGQPVPGADPSIGVPLGIVIATASISFTVTVQSLPASQQLSNQASSSFAFTLPGNRTLSGTVESNILTIPVSAPNVSVVKSTPRSNAVVGDIVPYTVTVTNTGVANITNLVVTDLVPAGAAFVSGSVTVDGVPRLNAVPANGIALGTIDPGNLVTVQFQLTVVSLPASAQLSNRAAASFTSGTFSGTALSNVVTVPVYQPIIALAKEANLSQATVGDTITYSIYVTNDGNWPAAVSLTDAIPPGAVFVPNSVIINGVPQPGANPSEGIPLGTIAPGDTVSVTVTLEVRIDTLPASQQLANQALASFLFTSPDGRELGGSAQSNTLIIPVSSPDVSAVKSTTAIDAVVGDILTYTIVVTNNGISPVDHVVLVDPDPPGGTFVEGSVTIDGLAYLTIQPASGIPIGTIAAGASSVITFQVQVVTI
ncbi:putative repeat protein (TIGR01451 family) [Paenibacillus phyllosphaerae]|uniref:Putative repeat protein (TIGR01451 family) n=1 Tax=Paenibacillus phyllosphaerae TaxID=274593 RepID=A0A7W5FP10_9BACL|nr:putative repeat protein (TIGR01451 family) [Paenibacillus phyllosphaerae]